MPRGRAWTTSEIAYLKKWAGRKSVAQIHRAIGKTPHAIEHMASRLGVSLRVRTGRVVWCAHCAKYRSEIIAGRCPVGRARSHVDKQIHAEAVLLAKLPPEARALKRPSLRGSRKDPKPTTISTPQNAPEWVSEVAKEQDALAEERWELQNIRREMAARRRRIERLKDQLKNF